MSTNTNKEKWGKEDKQKFLNVLLQERQQKLIAGKSIREVDWIRITDALNAQRPYSTYTWMQCNGKYNRMKSKYRSFSKCKDASGFGWDAPTGMILGSPQVWSEHVKKHPDWKPFQKKGMPHYDVLHEIFENTFATGQFSKSSTQVPLPGDSLEDIEPGECFAAEFIPSFCDPPPLKKHRTYPEYKDIATPSTKKAKENALYCEMMESIIESSAALQAGQKAKAAALDSRQATTPPVSETKCLTTLTEL